MEMLDARWLRTFIALCEERNFTATATRLGMTQPGVSQHIRKLEQQAGTALVDRDASPFALTAAGRKLFKLGLRRASEDRDFLRSTRGSDPDAGEVCLACSGSFATFLYPALIEWMQKAPGLVLSVEAAPEDRIMELVMDNRCDLGVVSNEPGSTKLTGEHLGEERLDLVIPCSQSPAKLEFAALQERGYIAHPDARLYADQLLGRNFPDDYTGFDNLRLRGPINQIGQIPAPVAQGVGYTILPRSGVLAFADREKLHLAQLQVPVSQSLWLVTRRRSSRTAASEKLARLIKREAQRLA